MRTERDTRVICGRGQSVGLDEGRRKLVVALLELVAQLLAGRALAAYLECSASSVFEKARFSISPAQAPRGWAWTPALPRAACEPRAHAALQPTLKQRFVLSERAVVGRLHGLWTSGGQRGRRSLRKSSRTQTQLSTKRSTRRAIPGSAGRRRRRRWPTPSCATSARCRRAARPPPSCSGRRAASPTPASLARVATGCCCSRVEPAHAERPASSYVYWAARTAALYARRHGYAYAFFDTTALLELGRGATRQFPAEWGVATVLAQFSARAAPRPRARRRLCAAHVSGRRRRIVAPSRTPRSTICPAARRPRCARATRRATWPAAASGEPVAKALQYDQYHAGAEALRAARPKHVFVASQPNIWDGCSGGARRARAPPRA